MAKGERDNLSEKFLFKGLDSNAFRFYFRQGGISSIAPRSGWLTNDWRTARSFAGPEEFSCYTLGEFCFAVIDRSVLQRNRIKPASYGFFPSGMESSDYVGDYAGEDKISWSEVIRIFVTEYTLDQIEQAYEEVCPSDISWNELSRRATVIEDPSVEFEKKLKLLARSPLFALRTQNRFGLNHQPVGVNHLPAILANSKT